MPIMRNSKPDLTILTVNSTQSQRLPESELNACGVPQIPAFGQYYVYASGPKLASMDRPKNKKSSANIIRVPQDYHNMMWDPRIYRGTTYKTYKKAEEERCKKHAMEQASNQQKKGARRQNQSQSQTGQRGGGGGQLGQGPTQRKVGGIMRPKTPPHHTDKIGLEDMGIQTERFLEEITDEVRERDMCTQTDKVFDLNIAPLFCPIKLGLDVSTQIEPYELFNFDIEAMPIISTLVSKIIEQALFETMEEMELDSLRDQQSIYESKNREQLMRLQRLYEREQKITEERSRLIQERRIDANVEKDAAARLGANLFAISYLGGVANSALNELRQDGHMAESTGLVESFIPWVHNRSMWQFNQSTAASTILNDVIKHVVDNREADVAEGIWREISAQNQLYQPETGISYLSAMSEDEHEE